MTTKQSEPTQPDWLSTHWPEEWRVTDCCPEDTKDRGFQATNLTERHEQDTNLGGFQFK